MAEDFVRDFFFQRHIEPKDAWLRATIQFLRSKSAGITLSNERLADFVYEQWLYSDIGTSSEPCLNIPVNSAKATLTATMVVQITSVLDVGIPLLGQFQKLTKATNENTAVTGDGGEAEATPFWEPKPRRMLSFQVTDGIRSVRAMEYRPITDMDTLTAPGAKLLLFGEVEFRSGVLLLSSDNCELLGGEVDTLVENNHPLKVMADKLKKQPLPSAKDTPVAAQTMRSTLPTNLPVAPPVQQRVVAAGRVPDVKVTTAKLQQPLPSARNTQVETLLPTQPPIQRAAPPPVQSVTDRIPDLKVTNVTIKQTPSNTRNTPAAAQTFRPIQPKVQPAPPPAQTIRPVQPRIQPASPPAQTFRTIPPKIEPASPPVEQSMDDSFPDMKVIKLEHPPPIVRNIPAQVQPKNLPVSKVTPPLPIVRNTPTQALPLPQPKKLPIPVAPPVPVQPRADTRVPDLSQMNWMFIEDAIRSTRYSIGPQMRTLKAVLLTVLSPMRIEGGRWALKIRISDGTQNLDCSFDDALLARLLCMTVAQAKELSSSNDQERKNEGNLRIKSLELSMRRLDLLFDVQFSAGNRSMPIIHNMVTLSEKFNCF